MNRKAILAILISLVVIAALVIVGLFAAGSRKAAQSITLIDGTRLSLRTVTYQAPHEVAYGSGWRDKLYRILPIGVARRLGAKVSYSFTTRTNSIVLWFAAGDAPASPAPGASALGFLPSYFHASVVDENGIETSEQYMSQQPFPGLYGIEIRNFPRRSHEITVRIYGNNATNGILPKLGDLKIINKFPVTSPGWTPESLPAKRETNGFSVTLLELETGRLSWGDRPITTDTSRKYSRAYFYLQENNMPAINWTIAKLHFDSAASGLVDPGGYGSSWDWRSGRFIFTFDAALWPEEPAWKMTAEVTRISNFSAEDLWVITNITIPGPREVAELNLKTNLHDAQIEMLGVMAQGAAMPKGWEGIGFSDKHVLHVNFGPRPADVHLTLVEARDDRGRKLFNGSTGNNGGDSTNKAHYGFGLKIPDDAKTMDVTIAISKGYNFEFMAKPKFTNAPPVKPR